MKRKQPKRPKPDSMGLCAYRIDRCPICGALGAGNHEMWCPITVRCLALLEYTEPLRERLGYLAVSVYYCLPQFTELHRLPPLVS